jgi:hypothetical protein
MNKVLCCYPSSSVVSLILCFDVSHSFVPNLCSLVVFSFSFSPCRGFIKLVEGREEGKYLHQYIVIILASYESFNHRESRQTMHI